MSPGPLVWSARESGHTCGMSLHARYALSGTDTALLYQIDYHSDSKGDGYYFSGALSPYKAAWY
eukprot:1333429-Rhodomonas_salina.2